MLSRGEGGIHSEKKNAKLISHLVTSPICLYFWPLLFRFQTVSRAFFPSVTAGFSGGESLKHASFIPSSTGRYVFFFPGANSKLHPYFRAIGGITQKRFITRHYAAVAVGSRPTDGGLMKLNSYFIARQERFQHKSFPCPLASFLPTVHCASALCMNLTPQSGEAPAQP